jgi:hypothetical protein
LNSPRYSNSKLIPCCGPPGGFDPTVWSLPQDRILRCGPVRGIESYGVAPPAGSTLLGLGRDRDMGRARDRDRTFHCGPSQVIGLSAVAPPAGSDFLLWPLPGYWTFRCGPSRGIGLSDVAPPAGLNPTVWSSPRDRLPHCGIVQIFFESMLLPLKGQSMKNVCMVEQNYPRPIIFML